MKVGDLAVTGGVCHTPIYYGVISKISYSPVIAYYAAWRHSADEARKAKNTPPNGYWIGKSLFLVKSLENVRY